ncbi:MAG: hypothetical protein IJS44_02640 [Clostridia bacterium]|nr:hypothetical protein [Clostridia bacterium]
MNNLTDVANVVIAIAAFYIAFRQYRNDLRKTRIESFLFLYKQLNTNQHYILEYIENSTREFNRSVQEYLYYPDGKTYPWINKDGELLPIGRVELEGTIVSKKAKENEKRLKRFLKFSRILPTPKNPFSANLLMYTDSHFYDAECFCFNGISTTDEGIKIKIVKRNYYDFVNSCMPYGFDATRRYCGSQKLYSCFSLRRLFPINQFDNRSISTGINTLVVLLNIFSEDENKLEDYILLHQRGNTVTESQGNIDAVPGCTFQPTGKKNYGNDEEALSRALKNEGIIHTITREFLEEIKSRKEFTYATSGGLIEKDPLFSIVGGNAFYLGSGINPINTYFELLTVLFLDFSNDNIIEYFNARSINEFKKTIDPNDEGSIFIEDFTDEVLLYYEQNIKSSSALKAICNIIRENKTISEIVNEKYKKTIKSDSYII